MCVKGIEPTITGVSRSWRAIIIIIIIIIAIWLVLCERFELVKSPDGWACAVQGGAAGLGYSFP